MINNNNHRFGIFNVTAIALFSALISVSSLIQIPFGPVPFTMQTFAVFLCIHVLGTFRSAAAVTVYILLGVVGIPVFSGFRSGPAAILGPTGGFLIGFIISCFITGGLLKRAGGKFALELLSSAFGLILLYVCGALWFLFVYSVNRSDVNLFGVLCSTVFPFIIPDTVKIMFAVIVGRRLKPLKEKYLKRQKQK